jgi:hypothetical protein
MAIVSVGMRGCVASVCLLSRHCSAEDFCQPTLSRYESSIALVAKVSAQRSATRSVMKLKIGEKPFRPGDIAACWKDAVRQGQLISLRVFRRRYSSRAKSSFIANSVSH